jgi:predicted GH43/DUF377 family glycosyl hydrolase
MSDEIKPIPTATELLGAKVTQLARFCDEPVWSAFNPSICYTEEHGYLVLLRSSNGILRDHREEWQANVGEELNTDDSFLTPSEWYKEAYTSPEWGSELKYHNKMFIAKLNPRALTISDIKEIDLSGVYAQFDFECKRGIEDGRLYFDGKDLRISATFFEPHGYLKVTRICNLKLNLSEDTPKGVDLEIFDSPTGDDQLVEKNWMPVDRGTLFNPKDVNFDYLYKSGETFNIDGRIRTFVGGPELKVSGGSQLIGLENGTMLGIIHQVVSQETIRFANITKPPLFRRRYSHRFMQYDEQGRIIKVTDMFTLMNKSIEFAAGIAMHDNKVLVTFGALDSSAHIASIPLKNILSNLRLPLIP